MMGNEVRTVHTAAGTPTTFELIPPHAPRVESSEYRQSHEYLIYHQDSPCVICGVRQSTLADPKQNRFGAKNMETHHYPIEYSLADACDPQKVGRVYAQVVDRLSLQAFIDSPANLMVLCDVHHRSLEQGIHHLLTQDFAILPFLYDDYQIVATKQEEAAAEEKDSEIIAQSELPQKEG